MSDVRGSSPGTAVGYALLMSPSKIEIRVQRFPLVWTHRCLGCDQNQIFPASRVFTTISGKGKKDFAVELFVRETPTQQVHSIEPGSKTLIWFTKLNFQLRLERIFLNFPRYSLTVTQKRLYKFRKRSHVLRRSGLTRQHTTRMPHQ
ncbi:hypothetical protein T265_06618 [Opisthorchis viverrini]|uniref:Uncharacterized protein n=1 Tax=Opisthorchis viverrini TaxID=6198 RepID=A0A075ADF6_OPIVI|nr:hypothetical protein T265_06618 [Opisthorchis viverrini]KER26039.1 hypothetical protein T265_06618 [Opisthorchis viverrini]